MKKLILLVILFSLHHGVKAQMTSGGKGSECAAQITDELTSCLSSNNITYNFTMDGTGTMYITAQGNPPPGQIQSCVAQYNHSRLTCPDAPIVAITNNNGNQQEKTPH